MRNIKFKVWAKIADDDGCVGFLEPSHPVINGNDFFYDGGWRGIGYFLDNPDSFDVLQFTGQQDRDAVEIYEGDLVGMDYYHGELEYLLTENIFEVVWYRGGFHLKPVKLSGDGNLSFTWSKTLSDREDEEGERIWDKELPPPQSLGNFNICVVLGNVFENQDLIEPSWQEKADEYVENNEVCRKGSYALFLNVDSEEEYLTALAANGDEEAALKLLAMLKKR